MSSQVSKGKIIGRIIIMIALCFIICFGIGKLLNQGKEYDTIIKGGTIYTGEDREGFVGDIAIKDGLIAAIGVLGEDADNIVDATGLAVSPGFIDLHSHTDGNLLICPQGDSKFYQGVTTDIGGLCGDSPFPTSKWADVSTFFDALRDKGMGINYGTFVGQGDLRSAVVGDNADIATPKQMEAMKELLAKLMEQGALGMSVGLEYAPGSYASDEELVELCKVVAKYDGLFSVHMRNEDDRVEESIKETIDIARKSGVRLQISHLKAQNAANWHKGDSMLRIIEEALASGIDIAFDRYPYIAFNTGLTSFIPLTDRQGSDEEVLARLKDSKKAVAIGEYAISRIKRLGGHQNVVLTGLNLPAYESLNGRNLEECSAALGIPDTWDLIHKILIEEKLNTSIIGFAMCEENVKKFLSHPLGMPSSDGSVYSPEGELGESMPHPRSYGSFPRFLGKYVREDQILPLHTAIHKCTALPASRLGLKDRGILSSGYKADIVIFDPATIADQATFEKPHQFCVGIEHIFVNGVWALKNGETTREFGGEIVEM